MATAVPRPTGRQLQDWQREPYAALLEQVRTLPDVRLLRLIAIPDRQVHLMYGPPVDELLQAGLAVCPRFDALPGLVGEVSDWLRWDRKTGYALAAVLAQLCTGGPLEPLARLLLSTAQVHYFDDSANVNLDTAYGMLLAAADSEVSQATLTEAEVLLEARFLHLSRWGRPFRYADCNPMNAHPYTWVSFGWLARDCPDAVPGGVPEVATLSPVVERAARDGHDHWAVVGGRVLGDLLSNARDRAGALAAYRNARDRAVATSMTTEIGHLRRLVGTTLIKLGLDHRRVGDAGRAVQAFRDAEAELEATVAFEAEAGCEYWAALTCYRLGDAQRYLDNLTGEHPDDPREVRSYDRGRALLGQHLAAQIVVAERVVKRQIFAGSVATALRTEFHARETMPLLAQVAADGSATAGDLERELRALRALDDDMRRSLASARDVNHLELLAAEAGREAYLEHVREHHEERLRYYVGKRWTRERPHRDAADLAEVVAARLAPATTVLAADPCEFDTHLIRFRRGLERLAPQYLRDLTEPGIAAAWEAFAGALQLARTHPAGARVISAALRQLLGVLTDPLAWSLGQALDGGGVERLVLLPYRQLSSFPWHAVEVDGQPLLAHCEVVYGHSIELLDILQRRAPCEGEARRTTMVYDDVGADFFEGLAGAGDALGIERVLRNPPWDAIEALGPVAVAGAQSASVGDPLFGHVLIYAPLSGDTAPPPEPEPPARTEVKDLFFACHGSFDQRDPLGSGLLLDGETRPISFADVLAKLDLAAWRGVVLGACETGLARRELATEQVGVGTAFLAAGVDHVVSSLWRVDRLATAVVFHNFFTRLRAGATYPAALRAAQLALRKLDRQTLLAWAAEHLPERYAAVARAHAARADQPFADPYYWAGFTVSGRP